MDERYSIEYTEKPAWDVIGQGINEYNTRHGGPENYQGLCFVLKDKAGQIAGGIIGSTYWNWFYLDLIWVREDLRRQGFGGLLIIEAENLARQRGAKSVYLDTFSFQAPDFYIKHGYHAFGELADFPTGHTRYFFTKQL